MTVIADVFKELFSMFVADVWLTLAVLILVLSVAFGVDITPSSMHVLLGFTMLAGCLLIIVAATVRYTRRLKRQKDR
ncbi:MULTISPECIES: hypothetical protein [Rhizobium]|uniref:Uncharacterized protein n=1 Tax=Rhizobium hidalgonense TaxID=1538159 RepID=A0ABX4JN85_9HYPH|nr:MULTISPECIES: hypothetical protein [Rhizobium]PDT21231.1 hypothetical protein CO674_23500 [Rhizobium hidalgonense]PON07882.1 hypothetical protein ATY29_09045 [Rhizobium hidalgonense]RFB87689.1 hypothetical protein B5K11_26475 [Rhizobium leguminosarum bv. trifolii]